MTQYMSKDIYNLWLENRAERLKAGFNMPESRATEDTAIMFDISIEEVCKALSVHRETPT